MSDVRLLAGDCRDVIQGLADDSVDAVVTDPPYSLQTINKRFAKVGRNDKTWSSSGPHQRTARGFMNQTWDTGEVAHDPAFWADVYRVLKPGAHLVAFGGTRTYHRLACAIEDAGFEIRDSILDMVASDAATQAFCDMLNGEQRAAFFRCVEESGFGGLLAWCFATGFPKSHSVSKAIDRTTSVERRAIATPATEDAVKWEGWGTALKPALEPICLARKPLSEKTVATNVLRWGTGALNIDGCRIESNGDHFRDGPIIRRNALTGDECRGVAAGMFNPGHLAFPQQSDLGRWPANICHDGSNEVLACYPDSAGQQGDVRGTEPSPVTQDIYGKFGPRPAALRRKGEPSANRRYADRGSTDFAAQPGARRAPEASAARFFFSAKADAEDRWGSKHPTVKPVKLIRWLQRMITPPGGTVLDPFAGSGTSGVAALAEGFGAILIEREEQYIADIEARLAHYRGEGRHSLAAKNRSRPVAPSDDDLFAVAAEDEAA